MTAASSEPSTFQHRGIAFLLCVSVFPWKSQHRTAYGLDTQLVCRWSESSRLQGFVAGSDPLGTGIESSYRKPSKNVWQSSNRPDRSRGWGIVRQDLDSQISEKDSGGFDADAGLWTAPTTLPSSDPPFIAPVRMPVRSKRQRRAHRSHRNRSRLSDDFHICCCCRRATRRGRESRAGLVGQFQCWAAPAAVDDRCFRRAAIGIVLRFGSGRPGSVVLLRRDVRLCVCSAARGRLRCTMSCPNVRVCKIGIGARVFWVESIIQYVCTRFHTLAPGCTLSHPFLFDVVLTRAPLRTRRLGGSV